MGCAGSRAKFEFKPWAVRGAAAEKATAEKTVQDTTESASFRKLIVPRCFWGRMTDSFGCKFPTKGLGVGMGLRDWMIKDAGPGPMLEKRNLSGPRLLAGEKDGLFAVPYCCRNLMTGFVEVVSIMIHSVGEMMTPVEPSGVVTSPVVELTVMVSVLFSTVKLPLALLL